MRQTYTIKTYKDSYSEKFDEFLQRLESDLNTIFKRKRFSIRGYWEDTAQNYCIKLSIEGDNYDVTIETE